MVLLRSCCLCVSPQTATFVLGSIGILASCTVLAPLVVFLEHHNYYITQFNRIQREGGNYMDDDQVPIIVMYSKVLYSVLLSTDIVYVFSCILLLVGVACKRHLLMIPWLVYMFVAILVLITIVISFIIGLEDYFSLAVFLGSSPAILICVYLWTVVVSAYQIIRSENIPVRGPASSASQSSLVSIKEGIQRVLGGTPPPPYEAVTTEAGGSPKRKKKLTRQISVESNTSDTLFFDVSSTRRSSGGSDKTASTKPASPTPFKQNQPEAEVDNLSETEETIDCSRPDFDALFNAASASSMRGSQSQSNLCTRHAPETQIKKSSSSYQNFSRQLNQVGPTAAVTTSKSLNQVGPTATAVAASKSTKSLLEKSTKNNQTKSRGGEDDLLTTWSSLSDNTSTMSSTSLDSSKVNNILV